MLSKSLDKGALSEEQFNVEIEKGIQDLDSGRVIPEHTVVEIMRQEYDI